MISMWRPVIRRGAAWIFHLLFGEEHVMENFTFYSPTFFVVGKDTENEAGSYVKKFGGSRVLIHYGGKSAQRSTG